MESRIKIILIGDPEKKKNFITNCANKDSPLNRNNMYQLFRDENSQFCRGIDFVTNDKFQIWDMTGIDFRNGKGFTGVSLIFQKELRETQVIIYLDPTPEQIAKWEGVRNENRCIAIHFSALKISPNKCLNVIENLLKTTPGLLTKNQSRAIEKTWLVKQGQLASGSLFSSLPKDMSDTINYWQYMLMHKPIFTAGPKPVYIALPQEQEKETQNENRLKKV